MRHAVRFLMIAAVAGTVALGGLPAGTARGVGAGPGPDIDASAVALNDLAKVDDVMTSKKPERGISADQAVRELMNQYKRERGIRLGNQGGDKIYAEAMRAISVNAANPDFGKFRVTAFDQAYGEALGEIAKEFGVTASSAALAELFQDESAKAKEFEEELSSGKSSVGALLDKLVALGDAVTGDKLRDYGVDPEKYAAADPDRKKTLLSERYNRKVSLRVTQTLGGVAPIQTFSGTDGEGNWTVGVIVMYSQKLQAVAESLRLGRKPAMTKTGPALETQLPLENAEKLFDLLGVRVLFDDTGLVVVSYGQWSNSYNGSDPRMRSRYAKTASIQAENLATAQLAEFLQATYTGETLGEVGEAMERALVKDGRTGEVYEPSALATIADTLKVTAKRRANAALKGLSTLHKWTYETPDGHEIAGVIKTYSFAAMDAAKKLRAPAAGRSGQAGQGTPSARMGQDQMDINDF